MSADLALRLGKAAAFRMAPSDPELDDLAQEAALAVLRVQEKRPDAPVAYLGGVARQTVRHLLTSGRIWTALDVTRGKAVDPLRRPWDPEEAAEDVPDAGFEEAVEWASLRPEIEAAIDLLPARGGRSVGREIARGVLSGLTPGEAARARGRSADTGRAAWRDAKPALAFHLSHLKELVA